MADDNDDDIEHRWEMEGGPAFPCRDEDFNFKGMSLRDWFAGQAIAGALADDNDDLEHADWDACAGYAYRLADAMLAARKKGGG